MRALKVVEHGPIPRSERCVMLDVLCIGMVTAEGRKQNKQ